MKFLIATLVILGTVNSSFAQTQTIAVCNTFSRPFHEDENRQIVVTTTEDEDFSRIREVVYRIYNVPRNGNSEGSSTSAVTRSLSKNWLTFSGRFSDIPDRNSGSVLKIFRKPYKDNKYYATFSGSLLKDGRPGLGDTLTRNVNYKLICELTPRAVGPERTPEELAEIESCLTEPPKRALGPIARDADGKILKMTYLEAEQYCSTRGGLPTAKQFALTFHPQGVSETPKDNFSEIALKDEDSFYYNYYTGYQQPKCEERYEHFWTSSFDPRDNYPDYAYYFYGNDGRIYIKSTTFEKMAVICADK